MNLNEFTEQLDTKGSALDQWPPAIREAAEALMAVSEEARSAYAAAQRADDALLQLAFTEEDIPQHVVAQILERCEEPPLWSWLAGLWWRPVALFGAPLIAGLLIGTTLPAAEEEMVPDDYPWIVLSEEVTGE